MSSKDATTERHGTCRRNSAGHAGGSGEQKPDNGTPVSWPSTLGVAIQKE